MKKKPWVLRHKILSTVGALVLLGIIISAAGGGAKPADTASSTPSSVNTPAASKAPGVNTPAPSKAPAVNTPAAPKAAPPAAAPAPGLTFPGKKDGDRTVMPGVAVELSGWTTTAGTLVSRTEESFGKQLCAPVTMLNRDNKPQDYNEFSWKLQSPSGDTKDITISGSNNAFGNGTLAPGGKKVGTLCWDDPGEAGTYVVLWQPDQFGSEDRGAWLNKR